MACRVGLMALLELQEIATVTPWELWQSLLGVSYASFESTTRLCSVHLPRREAEKQMVYQSGVEC